MDRQTEEKFEDRFDALVSKIREEPAVISRLSTLESHIVREALNGDDVDEIARRHDVSKGYVMTLIKGVAQATGGQADQLEHMGLGRDHDKNLRGGFGDMGQANIDVQSPTTGRVSGYQIDEAEDAAAECEGGS